MIRRINLDHYIKKNLYNVIIILYIYIYYNISIYKYI